MFDGDFCSPSTKKPDVQKRWGLALGHCGNKVYVLWFWNHFPLYRIALYLPSLIWETPYIYVTLTHGYKRELWGFNGKGDLFPLVKGKHQASLWEGELVRFFFLLSWVGLGKKMGNLFFQPLDVSLIPIYTTHALLIFWWTNIFWTPPSWWSREFMIITMIPTYIGMYVYTYAPAHTCFSFSAKHQFRCPPLCLYQLPGVAVAKHHKLTLSEFFRQEIWNPRVGRVDSFWKPTKEAVPCSSYSSAVVVAHSLWPPLVCGCPT